MSRVPSSLPRRRREPETSPPRREDGRPAACAKLPATGAGARPALTRASPAAGALSLRRESRRPAQARRGEARPARNCPSPPQAPPRERASDRPSERAPPPPPRHAPAPTAALPPACEHRARHRPRLVTTPTTSAARRPVRSWILAGTRGCSPAGTQRGRRELPPGLRGGAARLSGSALELTSSRRPERGFPPASTASSQLCRRRRCRKRRRGNRLTSPPDCACAPRPRPFGRARPLKGEWPARSTSRAPRAGRGGATAARGAQRRRLAEPAGAGLAVRPPVALPGLSAGSLLLHS